MELGGLTGDLLILLADSADGGKKGLSLRCKTHAEPVAGQKFQTQLVLQSGNNVTDGGLCVTEDLGSLGKAAQVCCLQ